MHGHEPINDALREHQLVTATTWRLHPVMAKFIEFFDLFNEEFFTAQPLPPAAISLERTRRTTLGHYVPGRNGTGICHNINLNSVRLNRSTLLEQLATLAHEAVHLWQDIYGRPSKNAWYHNKEFCQMATGIGIVSIPPRGQMIKITDPFLRRCRDHGVDDRLPDLTPAGGLPLVGRGMSTLKKWSCRCSPPVNVRVAIASFDATCNRCGHRFRRTV